MTMHYDLGSEQRPVTEGMKTIFTIPDGYRPSLQYTKYEIYLDNNSYFWIEQVSKLLGHTKLDTTQIYCSVNQENVRMSHRKYLAS